MMIGEMMKINGALSPYDKKLDIRYKDQNQVLHGDR